MSRLGKRKKRARQLFGKKGGYLLPCFFNFFYFTSDTMVRMGGGHLLCLIMKPHFFFYLSLSLSAALSHVVVKKKPMCIVIHHIPVFVCVFAYSFLLSLIPV